MGILSKVSELFNVKTKTESKEKFYNQLEKIIDRASKDDSAYLLEARKFLENIIKETFDINDKIIDPNTLLNDYISDLDLKSRLHSLRKRANEMAHSIDYKYNRLEIESDLKAIDDLIDYCCFKNEKINDYELFSLMKRITEEPKIDDDQIFSSKVDTINFEEIEELFSDEISDKYEYYTSGYNAKTFCMAISDPYRKESKDCDPIFYVVHNILIRKDMVRKSAYLNSLDGLTSAVLDSIRLYEILILHSMKYGYFDFNKKNVFSVPDNEINYIKYAYNNIMAYAGILNKMKKNPINLDFEYEIETNDEAKFFINNHTIKYDFPKYSEDMKVNMWFGDKIDYEITNENKNYFNTILKDLFGFDSFREGQLDVIKNILENNIDNIPLSVFPTGYGKSLIYQFCALLEPQRTIVIVPTEVLACDQIFNLNECGLNIGQIISCYEKNLNDRNGNLIYYTIPDVFLNCDLNDKLSREDAYDRIYNIVLDECHNISLWGHQFDPTYFSLSKNIISSFKNCNVTMFTATASMLVIDDITHQFSDKDVEIYQPVGLKRGHINYTIKKVNNLSDIIKDISNIYKKNYKKDNEWDLSEENTCPNKTLIINNDPNILNQIYDELQNNDYILPEISLYDNTVNNYKSFRTGRKKVLVTNDDFVVGINIPDLVNLICIGVPPSKEWLYQESGRVGRDFQNSNVIIYLPKKPSELFNKMIDTSFDIKDILANKELQSELNIDVSNINYFNSYFQNKEKQLESFDYVNEQIHENIYVVGKNPIGELNVNFPKSEKELYNYLLYMMVLFDYIRVWQTRSSETINTIKYRLYARSKINISEMKDYLNEIIKISTKNKELRSKYIRMNNKVTELRDLLSNLLDWYYETIITIKREMMVNTYELLLNDEISSEEIEQNLAIYFDISSNMRSNDDNFEFDNYEDEEIVDELKLEGLIDENNVEDTEVEIIDEVAIDPNSDIGEAASEDNIENVSLNTIKSIVIKKKKSEVEEEPEIEEEPAIKKSDNNEKNKKLKSKNNIDKLKDILSKIYNDKSIDWKFYDVYHSLTKEDKYNLQFILQKEIESGYIYGYEMMISVIELETKGSKLVRFKKFAQNTNKQLLELLIEKESTIIPHTNKKLAYKIVYSIHKPDSIFDRLKTIF